MNNWKEKLILLKEIKTLLTVSYKQSEKVINKQNEYLKNANKSKVIDDLLLNKHYSESELEVLVKKYDNLIKDIINDLLEEI